MKSFLNTLFLIVLTSSLSGNNEIDSLLSVYNNTTQTDSIRAQSLFSAGSIMNSINPDSSRVLRNELITFSSTNNYPPALALAHRGIAYGFYTQGIMDSAEYYFLQAADLSEQLKMYTTLYKVQYNLLFIYYNTGESEKGENAAKNAANAANKGGLLTEEAQALQQLGNIYQRKGEGKKSLETLQKALTISEKLEDKTVKSYVLGTLGLLHYRQGEAQKGLDYILESIELLKEIGNDNQLSAAFGNLAMIYNFLKRHEDALEANTKALEYSRKIGDFQSVGITLMNMGIGQAERGDHNEGLAKIKEANKLLEEHGDVWPYNSSMKLMGLAYAHKKDYKQSSVWCLKALKHSQEKGLISLELNNLKCVYQAYKNLGQYKEAFYYYQQYKLTEDSLYSEDRAKEFAKQESKFEYEKQKTIDDAENEKQLAIKENEAEKQQMLTTSVSVGLALVLLFLFFVFNRLRVTKRQKRVIEQQKGEVEMAHSELEEKNQEITDSINYAKRIQSAILPPLKLVKEYLQESFILYKPKDIVAGDFYWMENSKKETLFAAADCTGHGVPGAMVSVVCNNALNRSVREHKLTDPGEILTKTREIVIQEFEKSDEDVKDGMDIALCSLEGNKLKYAGANNPLWILRKGEIIETKADKQPIGKVDNPVPYKTHHFDLEPGDTIYVFSDGYVDQFGGEKGKKFKAKAFKELLLSIQDQSMEQQKDLVDAAFEKWKGNLDQIDDVCIIGVRV